MKLHIVHYTKKYLMSVIFERGANRASQVNEQLEAPKGWFTAEELERSYTSNGNERPAETELFIKEHLPMAAKRTERLIDALERKFNIPVPESYLRVRADGVFQVLLMVRQSDYISPKIAAARILADEYARTNLYDICFTFSNQAERAMSNHAVVNGYRLKHIKEQVNPQTRITH